MLFFSFQLSGLEASVIIHGGCAYEGYRNCIDAKNQTQCIATEANPNNNSSFCYWISFDILSWCFCCSPITCPPPQLFNSTSCSCVCPNRTTQQLSKWCLWYGWYGRLCSPGMYFNRRTCSCGCPSCPYPKVPWYNSATSRYSCVCPYNFNCPSGHIFNHQTCSCVCSKLCIALKLLRKNGDGGLNSTRYCPC